MRLLLTYFNTTNKNMGRDVKHNSSRSITLIMINVSHNKTKLESNIMMHKFLKLLVVVYCTEMSIQFHGELNPEVCTKIVIGMIKPNKRLAISLTPEER